MTKSKQDTYNELVGLIYLLAGVFLAVAFYVPQVNSGPLGRFLLSISKVLVGPVALVFPFILFILSLSMFLQEVFQARKIRVNHVYLLLIVCAALIHSFSTDLRTVTALATDRADEKTATMLISVLAKASIDPTAYPSLNGASLGGILGGLVAMGLQRITGEFGAQAILITALVAEAMVLGNFSISRIFLGIAHIFQKFFSAIGSWVGSASDSLYDMTRSKRETVESDDISVLDTVEDIPFDIDNKPSSPKKKSVSTGSMRDLLLEESRSNPDEIAADTGRQKDYFIHGLDDVEETPVMNASNATVPTSSKETFRTPDFDLLGLPKEKKEQVQYFDLLGEEEKETSAKALAESSVRPIEEEETPRKQADIMVSPAPAASDESAKLDFGADEGGINSEADQAGQEPSDDDEDIPDLLEEAEEEKPYEFPPITLLQPRPVINSTSNAKRIRDLAQKLEDTLESFGVNAKVVYITTGPSITRFELKPGPGVKISRIVSLSDDIALALAATTVRIEAPIPGKSAVGIEIPNPETAMVGLRSLLEDENYQSKEAPLLVPLGRDIPGQPIFCDLSKMPHLLIAGATGSGKSVCINTILLSLLYRCSPKELKLILVDPKVVELSIYDGIPHLLAPVVTDPKKAANTLNWAVEEMNNRYKAFAEHHVRDMQGYNELAEKEGRTKLPYVVLVIDELSDLMATAAREVEESISRLTAMARAAGIHLVIATQRPSVDVITGVIKANVPSRIAFAVSSQVDSRTILDGSGAEKLLGKGDMLYAPQSASKAIRGQGAFVDDHEVENVISFLRAQNLRGYTKEEAEKIMSTPSPGVDTGGSMAEPDEDELLPEAVQLILEQGYASVSLLQRRLNIGHPRAGRLIDAMEMKGYVGPHEGSKPRKVLLTMSEWAIIQAQEAAEQEADEEVTF